MQGVANKRSNMHRVGLAPSALLAANFRQGSPSPKHSSPNTQWVYIRIYLGQPVTLAAEWPHPASEAGTWLAGACVPASRPALSGLCSWPFRQSRQFCKSNHLAIDCCCCLSLIHRWRCPGPCWLPSPSPRPLRHQRPLRALPLRTPCRQHQRKPAAWTFPALTLSLIIRQLCSPM